MKEIFKTLIVLFLIFLNRTLISTCGNTDLCVYNSTQHNINICLYPISMVFNGIYQYDFKSPYPQITCNNNLYYYDNGVAYYYDNNLQTYTKTYAWYVAKNSYGGWKADTNFFATNGFGRFCRGLYKLEIQHLTGGRGSLIWWVDSCLIEYDGYLWNAPPGDLEFTISKDSANDPNKFSYQFINHNVVFISYNNVDNYYVKCWQPDGPGTTGRNKIYGPVSNNGFFDYYPPAPPLNYIPLDSRRDCSNIVLNNCGKIWTDNNQVYPWDYSLYLNDDERVGELTLNLFIHGNVQTRPNNWQKPNATDYPYLPPIIVDPHVSLKLIDGTPQNPEILNLAAVTDPNYSDFFMTVKSYASLILGQNTVININNRNHLILVCNSNLICPNSGATINVYGGGTYCSGADKTGLLNINYYRGRYPCFCPSCSQEHVFFGDSTIVTLDSGAVLQIPDSTNFVLDGANAKLVMTPTSSIQFSQNSKLTLQNGAHIFAKNCTFQSDSTGNPWDGIYLSGNSNDTITNCIIENASNGINITDKSSTGINQPSTEISNCTFIDSSGVQLNDGIYCSNSSNVLIKNNTFTSTSVVEGFANAIAMLYCSSYNLDILDNTINNVTNGMSIIQSSPYIERNTVNGQASDGTGIILDNSNGTLRYNTINHFAKALVTYYSTAYLFRNNFNYSSNNLIDLYQSSAPVLKPVNSGGTLLWLGGNNFFNGTQNAPSLYGIGLNDGSFPSLDSGFNNIVLGGANYMAGDLFSNILPATYNYWGDRPPVDNKFAVSNGSVIDTPDYDGSSLPKMNGYELTDIGFGLYDTIYTSSGNSPGADNLFTQAYTNEVSHNYATAIGLYKQVVSTYKTSSLVPAAIGRILNCMEKKSSTREEYSQLQGYMLQVRNNNQIPYTSREIAEDLIIKSIVRQNLYPYSINDYDSMYVHNEGNNKGIHAMINKLSILSFYHDSSGNHFNVQGNSNQYKLSLLSLLTGKQISPLHVNNNPVMPKEFKLYQNYPNPFNPSTKIKYDVPKYSNVTIKIYDLLGREIYSMSEYKVPGTYEFQFDGSKYASGVYFYRIESGDFVAVKKMVLLK